MFQMTSSAGKSFISRHKTAIKRPDISRPIRLALEHGLLNLKTTFFDYGCGYGDDVNRLREIGVDSTGWDPNYHPTERLRHSEIVNLGYVVNVIEDPVERASVLREAWSLARKLLIVSARLTIEEKRAGTQTPYADGGVTSRGTFQKFYEQHELRDWLSEVLGAPNVAVAPGVFFVFRDPSTLQSFTASGQRRAILPPRQKLGHAVFERNRHLLDKLIAFVASRGRLPDKLEIDVADIQKHIGSLQRAFSIIRQVTGSEQWDRIREARSQDLLVYLALNRFGGRPRFSALSSDIQLDVRAFFSTYRQACELADALLFSVGKPEVINEACRMSQVGKQTPDALYIHISALPFLPAVLRAYEGCARGYIGAVEGANVIKLHRWKPKVSYLHYPEFDSAPHPALAASLVVPLQDFHVRYYEYDSSANPFILHRKEAMVAPDYPLKNKFARLTKQEERVGLYEKPVDIGTSAAWQLLLREKGVYLAGHRLLRRRTGPEETQPIASGGPESAPAFPKSPTPSR
jgi:DNA phosphorothioation-associated putative methyltransferase